MSSFYESLPENFIRIHNSYIINMNFLEVIQSSYVIINNNKIPISKNYKADFLKKNQCFVIGHLSQKIHQPSHSFFFTIG
ncbi:LytTR family transcriptional regulator DNA-binding domain-containing protein [Flavobacterium piscinae]|uniref:LytTR family transcriptional regulator DNA-binding domain-containing protein n=1 Tax=Flavobacterium piscinae TaxID=2506424 RepID=UPI00370961C4